MKILSLFVSLLLLASATAVAGGEEAEAPKTVMTEPETLLFADDFGTDVLTEGPWRHVYSDSKVENGELVAAQAPDADHGAVLERLADFRDVVIRFSFQFDGSTRFNVPIDDKQYKESHAGHICRLSITPTSIFLGDDKEGVMRNDIFAMRRSGDPADKKKADALLEGRNMSIPVKLEKGAWHAITLEILGDEMLVSLDDEPIGYLQSSGIAHETKTDFGFTVNGRFVRFDNVAAWTAVAAPDWEKRRAEVLTSLR